MKLLSIIMFMFQLIFYGIVICLTALSYIPIWLFIITTILVVISCSCNIWLMMRGEK